MPQNDPPSIRLVSGRPGQPDLHKHRSRHHSQGFFEPSLPTASYSDKTLSAVNTLSASRIAAQTAMQHQQSSSSSSTAMQQQQKRPPHIIPYSQEDASKGRKGSTGSPSPPRNQVVTSPILGSNVPGQQPHSGNSGFVGGHSLVATTAANAAFPRSPGLQHPGMSNTEVHHQHPQHHHHVPAEREHKPKGEKSKMKLFSKPRHIGISRDKDLKDKALPSPNKMGSGLSRMVSSSATSLADTPPSNNSSSMYNLSNASSNTVIAADRQTTGEKEKDKDKAHKHHFLSRQKLNLKLKSDDHYNLPLSSASSNSRPADPNAPQSLYSFTPSSPVTASTAFGRSVSGLDLLHGLREKKKEEKALAESEQLEWLANSGGNASAPAGFYAPSSLGTSGGILADAVLKETLQGFGLNNMTPEDVWDFLKAKLLVIFDGEDVRIAIEDLNKLVSIHIQLCVQRHAPIAIVDDLRELLVTGFSSLDHALNGIPDDKLVPHLVQIWMLVFGTILPFIQVVFLPLDLEFKGCGSVMSVREAHEFWSALQESSPPLDVREIVLIAFRDTVILTRFESLKATFSRLSLDSINASLNSASVTTKSSSSNASGGRPGTAASLDAGASSFSSQSSTLFNMGVGSYSSDSPSDTRSRAASNTSSNPDQLLFQSVSPSAQRPTIIHRGGQTPDSSHLITETVGRMLQCVSVLASVQTGDEAQEKIELLSKALKHNWLGRARTGRDRRGFVGAKIRLPASSARGDLDAASERSGTISSRDRNIHGNGNTGSDGVKGWNDVQNGSPEISVS